MKAYLVKKTFKNGGQEGVMFTDKSSAIDALSGDCTGGSTLAVEWCDIYGGDENIELVEIEI